MVGRYLRASGTWWYRSIGAAANCRPRRSVFCITPLLCASGSIRYCAEDFSPPTVSIFSLSRRLILFEAAWRRLNPRADAFIDRSLKWSSMTAEFGLLSSVTLIELSSYDLHLRGVSRFRNKDVHSDKAKSIFQRYFTSFLKQLNFYIVSY